MNFFDLLFWMGMLCLFPVIIVVVREAMSTTPRFPGMSAPRSSLHEGLTGLTMPSDLVTAR